MRRPAVVVALLLAVLAEAGLSGCVGLPDRGAVHSRSVADTGEEETLVDYTPSGPRRGSTPSQLVEDFLTSMRATPMTTRVARKYLTRDASARWSPDRGTVVYGSEQLVPEPGGGLVLRLRDVVALDDRGAWLGDPTDGRGRDYDLRLQREDGEWRIADLPDRLLIPRSHFDAQYQQYALYFFDPTGQVLVPEPVYAPRGRQAPTMLLTGLLRGPAAGLGHVERSYLPVGTRLDGASVPVSLSGTAEVPLTRPVADLGGSAREHVAAQLAWTLSQVGAVEQVRITVGGAPLRPPGTVDESDVSRHDPSLAWASSALFGVRAKHVVTVEGGREERLSGPFGALPLAPRSIAVDGLAQHVAGVSGDGRRLLLADRDGSPDRPARSGDVRTLLSGTDLLTPVYDLHGQLWVVDRTAGGARLWVVRDGVARAWAAPGVSGADVRNLLVSRDGTRLVVDRRRGGRDELVVLRVGRDDEGRVTGLGPDQPLGIEGAPDSIIDIAWRTPTEVAVLASPASGTSEVLFAKIDGSSTATELSMDAALFRGRVASLVTSSSPGAPLALTTSTGRLYTLTGRGRWTVARIPTGLLAATYVD